MTNADYSVKIIMVRVMRMIVILISAFIAATLLLAAAAGGLFFYFNAPSYKEFRPTDGISVTGG